MSDAKYDSAFPHQKVDNPQGGFVRPSAGMLLRDYFAAHALPMLSQMDWTPEQVAIFAYGVADALLAERERL